MSTPSAPARTGFNIVIVRVEEHDGGRAVIRNPRDAAADAWPHDAETSAPFGHTTRTCADEANRPERAKVATRPTQVGQLFDCAASSTGRAADS